ncbi:hypothetical protein ABQW55_022790 (plasmid) [Xanthomonas citri pv. malvacearum]|uniref:hypothetical protein n=2 Tax=Xanthomonas citri TaxID=346 RepID=UPI0012A81141|nr:hypothetical protein [Xanthomonas citri]QGL19586.1 hypothetical protein GH913_22915 [Xanthomonas citri pv. malvacearum]WAW85046.1 hypothetical protein LPY96_00085 [Xanthomonas citri pv. malvacearum]
MKKSNRNEITAAQAAKTAAMVDEFFDALEPPARQGRTWTFGRLTTACDDPNAEAVQAVLYPNERVGRDWCKKQPKVS